MTETSMALEGWNALIIASGPGLSRTEWQFWR